MSDPHEKCSHGVSMAELYCRECSILWHEEGEREARTRMEHHRRCLMLLRAPKSTGRLPLTTGERRDG